MFPTYSKNDATVNNTKASVTPSTTTEMYIVLPGPEDISINQSENGFYQRSVTLTARMWPPVEVGTPQLFLGLPPIIWWGILTGCLIILALILVTFLLCCWLLPNRRQKILSPVRAPNPTNNCNNNIVNNTDGEVTMAQRSSLVAKQSWNESMHHGIGFNAIVPPQYIAPPPPPPLTSSSMYHHQYMQNYQQHPSSPSCGVNSNTSADDNSLQQNLPETHKSMWAINPLYASNGALSESENSYRTRSLPAWGKAKQRPISTTDDLEELYAKVNLSKKRRNRMRNGEAAIIALCRSRSQNLSGLPLDREGVVIYDERTAL